MPAISFWGRFKDRFTPDDVLETKPYHPAATTHIPAPDSEAETASIDSSSSFSTIETLAEDDDDDYLARAARTVSQPTPTSSAMMIDAMSSSTTSPSASSATIIASTAGPISATTSLTENPKKRRRAATLTWEATISAPLKRGGHAALNSALTWGGAARSALVRGGSVRDRRSKCVPKIVLDTPDGRSHTIYLKD